MKNSYKKKKKEKEIVETQLVIENILCYKVLVVQKFGKDCFDYLYGASLNRGQLVIVPFGKKKSIGIIMGLSENSYEGEKKFIEKTFFWTLKENTISFIEKFSKYHLVGMSMVLEKIIQKMPKKDLKKIEPDEKKEKIITTKEKKEINLNEEQSLVFNKIKELGEGFQVSLIFGITGSGKTEVYLKLIENILKTGGQILFLLPEIGIIGGMEERVKEKIQGEISLWFSGVKTTNCWSRVARGEDLIILGARSALFLPFQNLKLIIVDEEHDSSYKDPLYHGRNMALLLGQTWNCPVILGSATPSTESYYRAKEGYYNLFFLNNRYGPALLPKVKLIQDDNFSLISKQCIFQINKTLEEGKQVLIYLNKRGFSGSLICNSCGEKQKCLNCDRLVVLHQFKKIMLCHLCDKRYALNLCIFCKERGIITKGYGVERLELLVKKLFPNYKVGIFSSDFCNTTKKINDFLERVKSKDLEIIIGTQITAKGHNFPELSLVVIINTLLQSGDFRGREVLLQNLLQVSGRAGRYDSTSLVLVQSNDLNISKWLQESAYRDFLNFSLEERKQWDLPPFSKLGLISGEHIDLKTLENKMKETYEELTELKKRENLDIFIFPPTSNPISRIKNKYRMFILLKTKSTTFSFFQSIVKKQKLQLEVNPYDFY